MNIVTSVTDLIGKTPLFDVTPEGLPKRIRIVAKLETENIGGSVKDRLGVYLVKRALEEGKIKHGGTIIEPTAGNTGIGLAIAARHYGLKLIVTVPEKFSIEKQQIIGALGGTVITTPTEEGMDGAIEKAKHLHTEISNSYIPNQFKNPWNPKAYHKLAQEIWQSLDGKMDEIVIGGGSGGTFTGVVEELKRHDASIRATFVQPEGAGVFGGTSHDYKIEGIGMDELTPFMKEKHIDEVMMISDERAFSQVQQLAQNYSLLVGSSSGAVMEAAIKRGKQVEGPYTIVTIFPDRADRYLSSGIFDERWKK